MHRTRLGTSGLQFSALTLGTLGWGAEVDQDTVTDLVRAYRDAGGSSFDTAYGYGDGSAEESLGQLLGEVLSRDEVTIATKAGISRRSGHRVVDVSRGTLLTQLDASLRRLGTDHVDLWMVHTWSDEVSVAETVSALVDAVRSGKARYVGVSNHNGWQLAHVAGLAAAAGVPVVADEVELSLLRRDAEGETTSAAAHLGVGLLAWSPLARGVLTGKYRHTVPADSRGAARPELIESYLSPKGRAAVEALATAADGLAVNPAQAALAWVLGRPQVASAIIGARTLTQLQTLLRATEIQIPDEVLSALDDVTLGEPGHSSSS
ncbi:aldo/keto reductase [Dermacoccaceae bacterium W4C1]